MGGGGGRAGLWAYGRGGAGGMGAWPGGGGYVTLASLQNLRALHALIF